MKEIFFKKPIGQGMMELVVSISIIILVIITVISLTIINLNSQKSTEQRILALQLAREGIEVVRNYRDSRSWLDPVATNHLKDQTMHYFIAQLNDSLNPPFWDLNYSPYDNINNSFYHLYLHNNGYGIYYNHNFNPVGGITPISTIYNRQIKVNHICKDTGECPGGEYAGICESGEGVDCTNIAGYQIKSIVQWSDKGRTSSVSLTDYLYLWR